MDVARPPHRSSLSPEPSEAAAEAVLAAELAQRRSALLREANSKKEAKAREAERIAARVRAAARRLELRECRGEVFAKLCAKLFKFDQLREMLNALVESVDEEIAADFELCAEHNELRAAAGEHEKLVPIAADVLQTAIALELGEKWSDGERPLHDWLATLAMPRRADSSPEAELARQGERLLELLKEHDHG